MISEKNVIIVIIIVILFAKIGKIYLRLNVKIKKMTE